MHRILSEESVPIPKFKVTQLNNFCRVFRLPLTYPEGFCFGGGYSVSIQLVDWFNPVPPKEGEYFCDYPIYLSCEENEELRKRLINFIKEKIYVKEYSNYKHFVITDYGDCFLV